MSEEPKICSWPTWKKRNRPHMYRVSDSTLGYVETISPTLMQHGFERISEERYDDLTPKEHARLIAQSTYGPSPKEVVYHVWRHNQGYMERIEVFYK